MNLTMLHPRFYRNDSNLDDLIDENCDIDTIFMAGELTYVYIDDQIPNTGRHTLLHEAIRVNFQ